MNDSNQNMRFCPGCGTKLDRTASFCFACGYQLEEGAAVIPEKEQVSTMPRTVDTSSKKETGKGLVAMKREKKKAKKKSKKTYRKGVIVGLILACIVFGILGFFLVGFMTSGTYQKTYSYYYNPASPASIEECTIYADTAFINVQYNTTPVSYYAKVDVNFYFSGFFVFGKTYQNYFNPISWENESSAALTLTRNHMSWIDPTNWLKTEWNVITLTLRTDVVYDITATSVTGGISMTAPQNVTINDIALTCTTGSVDLNGTDATFTKGLSCSTTTGSTILEFTRCTFGDNIVGGSTTGGVNLKTYNLTYTKDITWTLSTTTGGIYTRISQNSNMGANITGSVTTTTGSISVLYYDNSPNYGARFSGTTTTGSVSCSGDDFYEAGSDKNKLCTTDDYISAINTYELTLTATTGSIYVGGDNN